MINSTTFTKMQPAISLIIDHLKRGFDSTATWVTNLSWKKFILFAIVMMIIGGLVQDHLFRPDRHPEMIKKSGHHRGPASVDIGDDTNVRIDESGIHILKKGSNAGDSAGSAEHTKSTPAPAAVPVVPAPSMVAGALVVPSEPGTVTPAAPTTPSTPGSAIIDQNGIRITFPVVRLGSHNDSGPAGIHIALPPDVAQEVNDAIDEVATDKANEQMASYQEQSSEWFMNFVLLLLLALFGTKVLMGGKKRAEAQAKAASADAEHANLQRQVSEAKMQMMQAQVEPHFLFNTLASVEHLIETDPPRASAMQKRLIQYLRAVLPQMRETALVTNLGREADIVRAYLDLLKMRMEERLVVDFQIPDGLRSAAFPPMMLQSLVENAIKHGLECKAEGGKLKVMGEVAHNKLRVSVTDDGIGFGAVPSDSTGLGLQSIRDRLKLLHGEPAQLIITPNKPSGVCATIEVPYQLAN